MKIKQWRSALCASFILHALLLFTALQVGSSQTFPEPQPIEVDLGLQADALSPEEHSAQPAPSRGKQLLQPRPETAPVAMMHSAAAAVEPVPAAPDSEEKVQRKAEADLAAASAVAMAFREPVVKLRPAGEAKAQSAPAAAPANSVSGNPAGTSSAIPEGTTGGNAARAAKNQAAGQLPSVISGPPPVYPRDAHSKGWTGKVRVRVLISEQGTVKDVVIALSSGYASLDDAARQGLRHWIFNPAYQNGRAVAAWVVVPVQFRLD